MQKKEIFNRWKTRGLKFKILTGGAVLSAAAVLLLLILALFLTLVTKMNFIAVWGSPLLYGLYAAALLAIALFFVFEFRTPGSRRILKANKDLENSHFMSEREIAKDGGFTVTKFAEIGNVNDGVLISAERRRDDVNVVLHKPIHTLIIATTGTGKTSAYVSPFIEIISRTATQPCMVITDPKGELYERHANTLQKSGYRVHIINLSMTYQSTLWNPFNDVWRKTEKISQPIVQDRNKYRWGGRVFATYADAEREKKEYTVRLNDEIYVDLQDLIYTACPVEAAQDKSWQQGARDLIFGTALRMWEDVRDGYMPKEKFNLYNLWWNLTEYARGDCEILKEYIDGCADEKSRSQSMASTVFVSEDRTLSSYLGSVNQYLHWLADGGVAQLTSGNEIEFSEWDESPNVLFIKVPDAKEGRHVLISLMLVQIYKALLEKASRNNEVGETSEECLKRNCYFLMDEFGSLPRIHKFEQIVTIARSRKIFLMPVIQSYNQLDARYGQTDAGIIKDNCNIRIFMGTNDEKTRNEISEACGKHKVKSVSYSENKEMSVSTSAQSVPLIYPSELKNLNNPSNGVFGNAIVSVAETFPIRGKTTPYFLAADIYGLDQNAEIPKKDFMIFDETENRYDFMNLVYLHHALDDEPPEPPPDEKGQNEELTFGMAERAPQSAAYGRLQEKVLKEMQALKALVDEADYLRLASADAAKKVELLDGIAERAAVSGDLFLAMRIEKIRVFLKHCGTESAELELQNTEVNYHVHDS